MPSASKDAHQVYQLNWGVFCALIRIWHCHDLGLSWLITCMDLYHVSTRPCWNINLSKGLWYASKRAIIIVIWLSSRRANWWLEFYWCRRIECIKDCYDYYELGFCLVNVLLLVAYLLPLSLSYPKKESWWAQGRNQKPIWIPCEFIKCMNSLVWLHICEFT